MDETTEAATNPMIKQEEEPEAKLESIDGIGSSEEGTTTAETTTTKSDAAMPSAEVSQKSLGEITTIGSTTVLQELLQHHDEIGNWTDYATNQEEEATVESFKSQRSAINIEQDGPFYVFVSNIQFSIDGPRGQLVNQIKDEVFKHFGGTQNLYTVHIYTPQKNSCMLRARDFESCIRVLRKAGENFRGKPLKVEYVTPNMDQPKFQKFTQVQLDSQLQMYKEAHPPVPAERPKILKQNPFGEAKPSDTSKILLEMEEKARKEREEEKKKALASESETAAQNKNREAASAPFSAPKILMPASAHQNAPEGYSARKKETSESEREGAGARILRNAVKDIEHNGAAPRKSKSDHQQQYSSSKQNQQQQQDHHQYHQQTALHDVQQQHPRNERKSTTSTSSGKFENTARNRNGGGGTYNNRGTLRKSRSEHQRQQQQPGNQQQQADGGNQMPPPPLQPQSQPQQRQQQQTTRTTRRTFTRSSGVGAGGGSFEHRGTMETGGAKKYASRGGGAAAAAGAGCDSRPAADGAAGEQPRPKVVAGDGGEPRPTDRPAGADRPAAENANEPRPLAESASEPRQQTDRVAAAGGGEQQQQAAGGGDGGTETGAGGNKKKNRNRNKGNNDGKKPSDGFANANRFNVLATASFTQ